MSRSSPVKRKRSTSVASSRGSSQQPLSSQHPEGTINPLSHTPSTLSQFSVAGLPDYERIPALLIKDFPHRPWRDPSAPKNPPRRRKRPASRKSSTAGSDGDESGDGTTDGGSETDSTTDSKTSHLPKEKSYAAEKAAIRPLAQSVAVLLSRNEIAAAKRAFGILMRSRVSGKPVDVRRNHYWEMGAEILMRERPLDETSSTETSVIRPRGTPDFENTEGALADSSKKEKLYYPLENVPQVREYFENLIRQFPHHLGARKAASALQFNPALFSYEIYQVHARQAHALRELEHTSQFWEEVDLVMDLDTEPRDDFYAGDDNDYDPDMDEETSGRNRFDMLDEQENSNAATQASARETRLRQAKNEIRLQTLQSVRQIGARLSKLLESLPFSRSAELWRLYGITSLYASDLLISISADATKRDPGEQAQREQERDVARAAFQKVMELGGDLEDHIAKALGMDREAGEEPAMPLFSSLPIRDRT